MSHDVPPLPENAPPLPYAVPAAAVPSADDEQLRLLAIFHFVLGPIELLMGCFPIIHLVIGVMMVSGRVQGGPPPGMSWIGVLFIVLPLIMILGPWGLGAFTLYSGLQLQRRRRRTLSLVVAGLNCMFFPFGTALGVFTLIVLCRRSVEESYRVAA